MFKTYPRVILQLKRCQINVFNEQMTYLKGLNVCDNQIPRILNHTFGEIICVFEQKNACNKNNKILILIKNQKLF